jgi:hypothetical protein
MPFRPALHPATLLRNVLSVTLSILLLAQGAMPAGYMPSAVDSGWPVMLCPEGLPENFLSGTPHQHHDHGQHLESDSEDALSGHQSDKDYCPLGSAFDTAVLTGFVCSDTFQITHHDSVALRYETPLVAARANRAQPRAPPIS